MDHRDLTRALRLTSIAVIATGLVVLAFQFTGDAHMAVPADEVGSEGHSLQRTLASPKPAPSFILPRLTGAGSVVLNRMAGHVVVINFWASWCTDCRKEAPDLAALWRTYGSRGVRFVGIDYVDGHDAALGFLHSISVPYPVIVDRSGQVGAEYGLQGLPTTFIVDAAGRVRYRALGLLHVASFRAALDAVVHHST